MADVFLSDVAIRTSAAYTNMEHRTRGADNGRSLIQINLFKLKLAQRVTAARQIAP